MQPDAIATPAEVDALLEQVLERPESHWPAALESLCSAHPTAAPSLRRRFQLLAHTGLVAAPPRPELLSPGQRFGDYQLLELVGTGGMGVVFRARREGSDDDVALKVLRPELLASDGARARFLREAAALRGVTHPAVCSLVDFGEHEGAPFLVMPFLRGQTLAAGIAEARRLARPSAVVAQPDDGPPWRTLCALFAQLADGLDAVHAQGLVHRDVKPGNILVRDGVPVLIDFGLAGGPELTRLTRSGEPLGTPAYMAPEQVRGTTVDARADVYGLAAAMYEAVALRLPFPIASREALYHAILHEDAADVRSANPQVPRALALVLQQALRKEPRRRYPSARALALDLRAVLAGDPVRARALPPWHRLARAVSRRPRASLVIATAGLLLVAGITAWQAYEHSRRLASEGLATSSAALLQRDVATGALVAQQAWRQHPDSEVTRSNLLVALSRNRLAHEWAIDGQVMDYVQSPDGSASLVLSDRVLLQEGDSLRELPDTRIVGRYSMHYLSAAWAQDGQSCLVAGGDGTLLRLSRAGRRLPLAEPKFAGPAWVALGAMLSVQVVAARTDGSFVIGDQQGGLRLIGSDGGTLAAWRAPGAEASIVFVGTLPDGMAFVTADRRGEVLRWNGVAEAPVTLRAAGEVVTAVAASADRRTLAVGSGRGTVHVLDLLSGTTRATMGFGVEKPVEAIALAPDGSALAAAAIGQRWALWDLEPGPRLVVQQRSPVLVRGLAFSPAGTEIALTDIGGRLLTVDRQGRTLFEVAAHRGETFVARFRGPGSVVTAGFDPVVREWRLDAPGFPVLRAHEYPARAVAWPDGQSIVSSGADGRVAWTRIDGQRNDVWRFPAPGFVLLGLGLSPDATELAVASSANADGVAVHRLHMDRGQRRLVGREPAFGECARSIVWRDGSTVILGEGSGDVTAFDVSSGAVVHRYRLPDGKPAHGWDVWADVGRDGRLVTASLDGHVRLWRADGTFERDLLYAPPGVLTAAFAPDGSSVIVGLVRGEVRRIDLQGRPLHEFEGGLGGVVQVRCSADGRFVGAVCNDGYLQVWTSDGRPWLRIPHPGTANALEFSPDSRQVAVACSDGAIRIWPVTEELIARLAAGEPRPDEVRTFLRR